MKLLRMLGLGLLVIDPDVERHGVDAVLDPGEYRPRRSRRRRELLLGEFVRRVGDPNLGGASVRNGIMTAYRQRALEIALFLQANGPTKASQVATEAGDPKAMVILAPGPEGAVRPEGHRVSVTRGDGGPGGRQSDLGGGVPVNVGAVAELAVGIVAPGPEGRSRGCIGRKDGIEGGTGGHGDDEETKDDESHCKQHESEGNYNSMSHPTQHNPASGGSIA